MRATSTDVLLLVDKPAGLSSHDVVALARRALGTRKVGHGGTLDPFATGLLVLLAGRGTRLLQFVPSEPKVYEATIAFGTETDTDDGTGVVVREAPLPTALDVLGAIPALTVLIGRSGFTVKPQVLPMRYLKWIEPTPRLPQGGRARP